ncbi:MAG: nucleoside deaminase [Gemmatimonadetes bacterium]|jgi:tRNA(Arg) A34 adenosine deaminase TadA|nr:nucleoside deaminase [Gemmatimonadota bacterium]
MRWERPPLHELAVTLPSWVHSSVSYGRECRSDEERMRLTIRLARENIAHGTGGPFGAAVFERESGRLVAVGVNGVVRLNNATAHAEMLALQLAQRRIVSYSLGRDGQGAHELFTSCAPCSMCLGAVLWSGVSRVVCGAERADAERIALEDAPAFDESYAHLRARGVEIVTGLLRDEARAVLEEYRAKAGPVPHG